MESPIPSVMAARPAAQLPASGQQLSLVADLGLVAAAVPPPPCASEPEGEREGGPGFDDERLSADAAARPRPRQDSRRGDPSAVDLEPAAHEDRDAPSTAKGAPDLESQDGGELDSDLPRWHHHSLIDPAALPPVLRHYVELKAAHPERVLLYRLGDFFEFFFEDAILLSRLLELTLTGKEAGKAVGRVPMAGIPHHAAERYCAELVRRGLSVALCDQLETTPAKGALLRRDITRVLTPGTVLEEGMLAARRNNWLCAVVFDPGGGRWGMAVADVSTGEFRVTEREGSAALHQELLQVEAAEVIWPNPPEQADRHPAWCPDSRRLTPLPRTPFEAPQARARLLARFRLASLDGLGLGEVPLAMRAAGGLLAYLDATQPGDGDRLPIPLELPTVWHAGDQLVLDAQTRRNLELTRTQLGGSLHGSLLWALDRTATAMGGRCLRRWIEAPLVDLGAILNRQEAVSELVSHRPLRLGLRRLLRPMGDLERLAGRAGAGSASARDLVALADGLERLPRLAALVRDACSAPLQALGRPWPELVSLAKELRHHLVEAPPMSLSEGGLIHNGVDAVLDGLRNQLDDQEQWLAEQEALERQASGNANLRLQYHRSFGYFLAVSRARAAAVPEHWIRRQTLANEERFVTPALKGREGQILQLRARTAQREYDLFTALRSRVGLQAGAIRSAARLVAELDVLASLAEVAATGGYCRPELCEGRQLWIEAGRHPVVEQLLVDEPFTANDLALGGGAEQPPNPHTGPVLGDGAGAPGTGRNAEQERRHGGAELSANGNRPVTMNRVTASDLPASRKDAAATDQTDGNNAPSGLPEAGFSADERVDAPDLLVLTGPNASGKSCYLRQTGLLQLMAQIGSWIPASAARLGIADRIFTRVGAVDDLASGQSTFMVEMTETANILHHASERSLVLLDEIGRGTATFDGLSIAWAVAEHLASGLRSRTIFATHYHELNELAELLPNVGNAQVLVQETGDDLVFLHRVRRGGASRSYGIEAARLAGVPPAVVLRARQVLGRIEANSHVAVGLTP